MNTLTKIWSVIEKHRWTVIVPLIGAIFWIIAGICCVPTTESPTRPNVQVNAHELQQDYETWVSTNELTAKRFEWATDDIKTQTEQWGKIESGIMAVVSGGVSNWSGLLDILISTGLVGTFADNLRKNGVIAGLKRNKIS